MRKLMTFAMAALIAFSAVAQDKIVLRLMGDSTWQTRISLMRIRSVAGDRG